MTSVEASQVSQKPKQVIELKNKKNLRKRNAERLRTHTLAELKRYKWLPLFNTYSGVILDISSSGIKLAFSGEVDVKPQTIYTLRIPLIPLGFENHKYFESSIEVKWFDQKNYRLGGLFVQLTSDQENVLAEIIKSLKAKSSRQK